MWHRIVLSRLSSSCSNADTYYWRDKNERYKQLICQEIDNDKLIFGKWRLTKKSKAKVRKSCSSASSFNSALYTSHLIGIMSFSFNFQLVSPSFRQSYSDRRADLVGGGWAWRRGLHYSAKEIRAYTSSRGWDWSGPIKLKSMPSCIPKWSGMYTCLDIRVIGHIAKCWIARLVTRDDIVHALYTS